MHRIDHATAVANMHGAGKSGFGGGNPTAATPATRFTPAWCDDVQENIVRVIEAAGIALVKGDGDQLHQAIAALIAASAISGLKALAYLDAGQGLESDGAGNARIKLNGATLLRTGAGLSLNLGAANVWPAAQSCAELPIPDAPTLVWDLGVPGAAMSRITLAGNRPMGAPTDLTNGTIYELLVIQPSAGGPYTISSFNAAYTGISGVTFSTAANAIDRLVFLATGGKMRLASFRKNIGA